MCWNIEGFVTKVSEPGFLEYLHGFDVCCLTETFTAANFDFRNVQEDYTVLHSPGVKLSKQGRLSGGVVMLLKKPLSRWITDLNTGCDFVLAVRVHGGEFKDTILVCAYIPPVDSPYYRDKNVLCNITLLEDVLLDFQDK